MKKLMMLAVCFLNATVLMAQSPGSQAPQKGQGLGFGRGGGPQQFFEELNLTQEQKDKLKNLRAGRTGKREEMRGLREAKEHFEARIKDYSVSESDLRNEAKQLSALHTEMQQKRLEHLLELRKILTSEQLGKFMERIHQKRAEFRGRLLGGGKEGDEVD